ncbi:MAG: hypothetical protein K2W85_14725 [Phycisphaerales bacterium]|nr:hypothetical protein [Phycisphaerales bacterium]
MRFFLMLLTCVCVLASAARADYRVGPWTVANNEWTLVPIVELGEPSRVDNVLALANPSVTFANNIVAVWYMRDLSTNSWKGYSWQSTDRLAAINKVKNTLGLDDSGDYVWPYDLGPQLQGASVAGNPTAFGNGLLVSDPLSGFLQASSSASELLQVLVNLGYPAANLVGETGTGQDCPPDLFFNTIDTTISVMTDAEIQPASGGEYLVAAITDIQCEHRSLWPITPRIVITPTPKLPIGPMPGWMSTGPCTAVPDFTTGVANCYCTFSRTATYAETQTVTCVPPARRSDLDMHAESHIYLQ